MRKLHFSYDMQIDYSSEVGRCNYTIKCIPTDTLRQKISNLKIDMSPETNYCVGRDGLRNTQIYGVNKLPHKSFVFHIEGDADTGLCEFEEESDDEIAMVFKHPHGMNIPGDAICSYFTRVNPPGDMNGYDRAKLMMHRLHEDFAYKQYTTNVNTTAEEAFLQGHGVCQDYAHIFIALMQLAGIPARYVTGMIVGEGASHAWVEILQNDKWYGFDPTNDKVVSDEHIKIGVGRDAGDCTINRGIVHGGGQHTQKIQVYVTERK